MTVWAWSNGRYGQREPGQREDMDSVSLVKGKIWTA